MQKLLTISIAAYNVEEYIEETLDSLVASKYCDRLEIFVVDDGGSDRTYEIAQKYEKQYPSVIPVHKENGGYGTTVNYSMAHATGKYFKLLDGDDWFDTKSLDQLIELLEHSQTDVLVTPFNWGPNKNELQKKSLTAYPKESTLFSHLKNFQTISMWSLCYRTDILRQASFELPGRTLYTDILYATIPFAYIKTIQYIDLPVYGYRVGRDGQSVSRASRIKNVEMMLGISERLAQFYANKKTNENAPYLLHRATSAYLQGVKTLFLLDVTVKTKQRLKTFDQAIHSVSPEVYKGILALGKLGKFLKLVRMTNYQAYYLLKVLYPKGFPNWI
ncbi:glycosyltransferase family 2 protein [Streptococcus ratti]|uniref:Cell wall biosynthesis glycosyltransferase n=1 Tax=Streptococcus ratti FA-1 = DSM 20564 TaxID=699248 RepID=A0ABN0GUD3_STRRT|nr:glycosyltransferase family 2 protein [Streptococcus ratti]EJN94047.1 cell wall biosynthesis glycosyltransferase [Streptococcus ratti FA-1 = DSM 20564]EMP70171.1 Glycosyltransferase [Streptococcus ratti FA-1 = DSM 20564]QEY07880.1 glycosyltransferase [Streptococcus ratti]VEI60349.1 cell wall biosynthesis glycosyltransferase [Streptococcus mutans]